MKKGIVLVLAVLAFYACEKPAKIGFVDNSTLINDYEEKKELEALMKVKIENFEKRNDSIGRSFQMEVQDAQIKAAKMSQKKQEELMGQLQNKQTMLQRQFQMDENAIKQESQTKNDSIINKIKRFIEKYGEKNGYDFIMGKNEFTGNLYYGKETYDLTKTMLEELNKQYAAEKK
ncbi:outer membrane protein (OmpH-like) [Kordia sp. SMS9]|uniref:OmpH family outer membrane protein n=1 Tax=Kordia sp. SMS9 TaxID=2282170 RepID=UPI000E0D3E2C|nr:OmpH family outer membrane protein [Kordia sp. SMS9]AXG68924.1 outer membrane protein (OmpH-like) [Kordia sp. SMS9]